MLQPELSMEIHITTPQKQCATTDSEVTITQPTLAVLSYFKPVLLTENNIFKCKSSAVGIGCLSHWSSNKKYLQ